MRPIDATGLVEHYAERRARYAGLAYVPPPVVRDLGPTPEELEAERGAFNAKIDDLRAQLSAAAAENLQLQAMIAELKPANTPMPKARVAIRAVQEAFCEALNGAGRTAEGAHWCTDHLTSPRRAAEFAQPRQLCMWLCRQICVGVSLPQIGRAFGGRDHTTAKHALSRAPVIMAADADMHVIALKVLKHFDCLPPVDMGVTQ